MDYEMQYIQCSKIHILFDNRLKKLQLANLTTINYPRFKKIKKYVGPHIFGFLDMPIAFIASSFLRTHLSTLL